MNYIIVILTKIIIRIYEQLKNINSYTERADTIKRLAKHQMNAMRLIFHNKFKNVLEKYESSDETAVPFEDLSSAPIWMCWLQGEEDLKNHPIASLCLDNVQKSIENHKLILITSENVEEYITIPVSIKSAYHRNIMRTAHYVDYIRVSLLEKYGGIWLDCSVLLKRQIPEDVLSFPLWSAKGIEHYPLDIMIPSGNDWQIYFLAAQKSNLFCRVLRELMEECSATILYRLSYFASYYLAELAFSIPSVRDSYSRVPENNEACEQLGPLIYAADRLDYSEIGNLLQRTDTFIYKLSINTGYHIEKRAQLGLLNII